MEQRSTKLRRLVVCTMMANTDGPLPRVPLLSR